MKPGSSMVGKDQVLVFVALISVLIKTHFTKPLKFKFHGIKSLYSYVDEYILV